jgi:hypothetical protein
VYEECINHENVASLVESPSNGPDETACKIHRCDDGKSVGEMSETRAGQRLPSDRSDSDSGYVSWRLLILHSLAATKLRVRVR